MEESAEGRTRRPPGRTSRTRGAAAGLALLLLVSVAGCSSMWDRVRESERLFAADLARTQVDREQCVEALDSLDRAQARIDLGPYAGGSTRARVRCYEVLGLEEMARGHRRLIEDFYPLQDPLRDPAQDAADEETSRLPVSRVADIDPGGYAAVPAILDLAQPRYSPSARRSKIVGRVIVAFDLTSAGKPTNLRVLEMPHPLLATWAMEAVAQSKLERKADPSQLPRGRRYVTTFLFSWRWATEPEEDDSSDIE